MPDSGVPADDSAPSLDLRLAERVASGDQQAFRILMRRFHGLLYRTARSIVTDDADAEDVLQNAYLLAYRKISGFRGEEKLSTWLVRIIVNEALAGARKRGQSLHVVTMDTEELNDAMESATGSTASRTELPEQASIRSDLRKLLETQIQELPLAYRTVFLSRAADECSVAETAISLDIPEATVRSRFFRARRHLCRSLSSGLDFSKHLGSAALVSMTSDHWL